MLQVQRFDGSASKLLMDEVNLIGEWNPQRYAKGTYQQGLLSGRYRWSGGDLRGKARRYSSSYCRSRVGLLQRLQAAAPNGVEITTRLVLCPVSGRRNLTVRRWIRYLVAIKQDDRQIQILA